MPRARRTRGRVLLLALLGALTLSGLLAQPALAVRKVSIIFSCNSTTFKYSGFPELENNQVTERLRSDGVFQFNEKFAFNGAEGTSTISSPLTSGMHKLSAEAHWNTNGVAGESGKHKEHVKCGAEPKPNFTIQKLQQIAGSSSGFTATELNGKVGQTVDYQITVSNTGNVPFTLSSFMDANCDPGTLAGGPAGANVAPGGKLVFTCTHLLAGGGSYTNVASASATYQEGGTEVHESNKVTVKVALEARLSLSKVQEIRGTGTGFTASTLTGAVGQTILYQMTVKNTGNAPLLLSEFTDIYCDEGTVSGGPGPGATLMPGSSTTYSCSHKLTEADKLSETHSYSNIASVSGTPSGGTPIVVASNMVIVEVTAPQVPSGTSTTPGNGNPGSGTATGTGAPGSLGGSSGSSGSAGHSGSGSLGTKSAKKHRRKVTVAHKTPKFTG
jgi:uncharacterized repeat protein (TIGR01451 family)